MIIYVLPAATFKIQRIFTHINLSVSYNCQNEWWLSS